MRGRTRILRSVRAFVWPVIWRGSVSRWLQSERYSSDGSHLDAIPFPDTESYVEKVLETRDLYRRLYPGLGEGAPEAV